MSEAQNNSTVGAALVKAAQKKAGAGKGKRAPAPQSPARAPSSLPTITFELVRYHAPTVGQAERMAAAFGIDPVDYAAVRETTEEHIVRCANALCDDLNPKAMEIHLQRVVGAFVGSAYGATQFYTLKADQARNLTMASQNDARDEDRDPVSGFESKAESARAFAGQMGLQAFALMAAAEGAINAFAHITGETWKAYERQPAAGSVSRGSAKAQMEALQG